MPPRLTKATELPAIDGAPHFLVRGPNTWGRASSLATAIKNAQAQPGDTVHVCRCDSAAYCDEVAGNLEYTTRGEIWRGVVSRDRRNVSLMEMTHAVREAH